MVLVLWDFLAIIPLSTDKFVSHGKLFLFITGFPLLLQHLLAIYDVDVIRLRRSDRMA